MNKKELLAFSKICSLLAIIVLILLGLWTSNYILFLLSVPFIGLFFSIGLLYK
ncbi:MULTISPECIES: hypothetical protein [Enterococcus]|uniref:Uncharacterized protein n=1 Tax=Candidatus Enterococcus ferrettii TaxID=2815324 RepID=A0ABV0EZN1_9ENTE|nr:hypothetical protein [Enterococcus sp. 665A]MBO1338803.1 hypothetical protein [Enterococcus sp. 665A]